jgi:hypothetical protein
MNENKLKRYLFATLIFQIIILLVGIVPMESVSDSMKLKFVILTNAGLLGGTGGMIYHYYKKN